MVKISIYNKILICLNQEGTDFFYPKKGTDFFKTKRVLIFLKSWEGAEKLVLFLNI